MRAVDLYAGIGGWSLGLRLAGIEVVASYEWWAPAVDTHNGNHGGSFTPTDVRQLDFSSIPKNVDIVVGSPPCTQFSYSNRGGGGDLAEGTKDLVRFFEVVDHVKPTWWAMENVPRVAEVLRRAFEDEGHELYRFRHLAPKIEVIDFSEYGTPQARKRCIATNISFDRIKSYRAKVQRVTLGDVVDAFAQADRAIIDPVWGVTLPRDQVTETLSEPPLNAEELRMNREAKLYHPVYNNMAFPDATNEPSRTVTATCTRVSRESIVIADPASEGAYRRLTIRERASLQGFPITYQFFGRSFQDKAKMVGNAIPPSFTYLLAQAAKGVDAANLTSFAEAASLLRLPSAKAPSTPPEREGQSYPATRAFRSALPGLRFKSGMRFELANQRTDRNSWTVRFFFGPSTDVREIELNDELLRQLQSPFIQKVQMATGAAFAEVESELRKTSPADVQSVWAHKADGLGPFDLTDTLGRLAETVRLHLCAASKDDRHAAIGYVLEAAAKGEVGDNISQSNKLTNNALPILSGMLVGAWFNTLRWHEVCRAAA